MSSVNVEDGVLSAAWPHNTCDCTGYVHDTAFKLPPSVSNLPVGTDQPQAIQDIVSQVNPCAKCWHCHCQAAQNLCHRVVRCDTNMEDAQKQIVAALGLVGLQQEASSAHWNLTTKEVSTKLAKALKECKTMETSLASLTEQVKLKDGIIETLKEEVTMYQERLSQDNDNLQQELTKLKEKVASLEPMESTANFLTSQVSGLSAICKNCTSCKRKGNQQGLLVQETDNN